MTARLRTGMENLLTKHPSWLRNSNICLLSHAAAVDNHGKHSLDLLASAGFVPKSLLGPEHGFYSTAAAGANVRSSRHAKLKIPVHSLYGAKREPDSVMLKGIDTIIVDIQNVPARCYTYLATLIHTMRAAEQYGIRMIVADRPVPLPNTVDGPPLEDRSSSFVAPAPLPMAYGMTPGETALWITRQLGITPELKVTRMTGYHREEYPLPDWPAWVKPSPGIVSWDSAMCYLSTVSCEPLPVMDAFRNTSLSFQAFSTPWLKAQKVCDHLGAATKGVLFHPVPENKAVLLEVTSPYLFKPVGTGIAILSAIAHVHGNSKLWGCRGARHEFFDKLFGGKAVRSGLMKTRTTGQVTSRWRTALKRFRRQRLDVLLYKR